jgi:sugar transferase (PEP-CTERM system associated)
MIRIFRHYIPTSLVFLGGAEALILLISYDISYFIRFNDDTQSLWFGSEEFHKALLFVMVMTATMTTMGLYHRNSRDQFAGVVLRVLLSFVAGFAVLSILYYAEPNLLVGRGVMALGLAFAFLGVFSSRLIFNKYLLGKDAAKEKILVVGTGNAATSINRVLRREADRRTFNIAGYVRYENGESKVNSGNIISHDQPLLEIARRYKVEGIVVAMDDARQQFPMDELLDCRLSGIQVMDLLSFFEMRSGKVMISLLKPSWLVFSDGFVVSEMTMQLKRLFDVLVSTVVLLIALPFMALTSLALMVESGFRSPVLYVQTRVGENGRKFRMYKFRSMVEHAEQDGTAMWASVNDDRITLVGKLIRKTRLDELPQLINVLKGDMSFVGPRPERPEFVVQLKEEIPYYVERLRVKPGITGWAQICYPYGSTVQDAIEKLQYDLYYIKNLSIFLDLLIIVQTLQVVLWGKGGR